MYSRTAPFLSVVIPSHAYGPFIRECLCSLQPSPAPLDIIVVENGTSELDRSLGELVTPHRFRLVRVPEADLSKARNVGRRLARGEFVLFLDADDVLDVEAVVEVLQLPEVSKCDAVSFGKSEFEFPPSAASADPEVHRTVRTHVPKRPWSRKSGVEFILSGLLTNTYSTVTGIFCFRRSAIELNRLEFTEGYIHEDHGFVFNLLRNTRCILVSQRITLHKRRHDGSLSQTTLPVRSIEGYLQAVKEIQDTVGKPHARPNHADLAARAVETRLLFIVAKKRALHAKHEAGLGSHLIHLGSSVRPLFKHLLLLFRVAFVLIRTKYSRDAFALITTDKKSLKGSLQ